MLWQASRSKDLVGEMALLLHMYAARTPEIVRAANHLAPLRKQRVDLAGLSEPERDQLDLLLDMARERGRELLLAATILPGSRLTEDALLALPDWELTLAHTVLTRDWSSDQQGVVVTDLRVPPEPVVTDEDVEPGYADEAHFADEPPHGAGYPNGGFAAAAQEQADAATAAADAPRIGRFRRRRHRPQVDQGERTIGLAEFFGRGDRP